MRASSASRRAIAAMATFPPTPRWCSRRKRECLRARWRRRSLRTSIRKVSPRSRSRDRASSIFRSSPSSSAKCLRASLAQGNRFGASAQGSGAKVNVEYVSANPTGPMHVGHGRGAVVGDAIASLLAFTGHEVAREYYINDAGAQVDVLARSAYLRYREALGETIGEIPAGLYPGDYLKPVGEKLARLYGPRYAKAPEAEWLPSIRDAAIGAMMELIREDLAALGIRHDVFFSERSLSPGKVAAVISELEARGLVYQGRLPPPKGQIDADWEDREQTLFRSTPIRRRRRPAVAEIGRQSHLLRGRHRLSRVEIRARIQPDDRRARRRSRRLCEAHAGGRAGRERRCRLPRRAALPARPICCGMGSR